MDLHKITGATQTPELRITQATGALLFTVDKTLPHLVNERITTYVERPNGGDMTISTNILLKHAIIAAIFGEGEGNVKQFKNSNDNTSIEVVIELADGSIILDTDETIKVKLTELTESSTYELSTIQFPESAKSSVVLDKLTILNDETTRSFDVENKDIIIIEKFSFTRDTTLTFSNGHRVKFTPKELKAISFDVESTYGYDIDDGKTLHDIGDCLAIPLVDVIEIEFQKVKGFQEITTVTL